MELIKHKDMHEQDYTWFWVHNSNKVSPIFPTREAALTWVKRIEEWLYAGVG